MALGACSSATPADDDPTSAPRGSEMDSMGTATSSGGIPESTGVVPPPTEEPVPGPDGVIDPLDNQVVMPADLEAGQTVEEAGPRVPSAPDRAEDTLERNRTEDAQPL
jgi:hypothetical protein